MHSMNYAYFNYLINIQILFHFIKYLIYQLKRFLFLNSKSTKSIEMKKMFFFFSAKQGDLQLALELEGCLEEIQAIHVTKQVLEAVAFLHDNKIVHLDIKVIEIFKKQKSFSNLFCSSATKYSFNGKMAKYTNQIM